MRNNLITRDQNMALSDSGHVLFWVHLLIFTSALLLLGIQSNATYTAATVGLAFGIWSSRTTR